MPFRRQLLEAFTALAILPLLVLALLQWVETDRQVTHRIREAQTQALRMAVTARDYAAAALQAGLLTADDLSDEPGLAQQAPAVSRQRLRAALAGLPLVDNILVVDRQGRFHAAALGTRRVHGQDATALITGLADTLRTGRTTYSRAFRSPVNGQPMLAVSRVLQDRRGQRAGAVVIAYGFDDFRRRMAAISRTDAQGSLYVAGPHGALVSWSGSGARQPAALTDMSREAPVRQARATRVSGGLAPHDSGVLARRQVAAYAVLHPAGWIFVVTQDYDELVHGPTRQLQTTLWLIVPTVLLAVGGAYVLSRRFARPMIQLSRAVSELPKGRLRLQGPVGGVAEFQILRRALQDAADEIRTLTAEREVQQASLETVVAQRTAALAATNRVIVHLAGELDLPRGLAGIRQDLRALVAFDAMTFWHYEPATQTLHNLLPSGETGLQVLPVADSAFRHLLVSRGVWIDRDLDVGDDPDQLLRRRQGFRSRLLLPIHSHQAMIGMLSFLSQQPDAFDDQDAARLAAVTEQIGLVIERERLFRSLAARHRDAERLARITGTFARSLRFEVLAPQILAEMQAAFGADRVGIWLYDDEHRMVRCAASLGEDADVIRGQRVAVRDYAGLTAALHEGKPQLIADPGDFLVAPPGAVMALPRSMAIFPLISEDEGLGSISLSYTRAGEAFPPERIPFAQAICAQAANALARARLVDRLEETLRRLQQVQDQLIRSERMSAIGQVASQVSHEIKNRFNVIRLAAGLGEMLAGRPDTRERLQTTMRTIAREVDRGNALLMSLLQFARPTAPKREPVGLVDVIETALLFAHRPNITVHRQWASRTAQVEGDPAALEQVFLNLILNAVQAMPQGGTLTIRLEESHSCWQVRIRDTGGGIPPEVLPHLFEPFITTKAGGTGLGLVITKQIVEAHAGRILCHSEPGQGTVFIVRLPKAGAAAKAA